MTTEISDPVRTADDPYEWFDWIMHEIPGSIRSAEGFESEERGTNCFIIKLDGTGSLPEPTDQGAIMRSLVPGREGLYLLYLKAPISSDRDSGIIMVDQHGDEIHPEVIDMDVIERHGKDAGLDVRRVTTKACIILDVGPARPWKSQLVESLCRADREVIWK